jgi:DNA modification methylase
VPADVRHGDCLDVMRTMPDASVHAIVTDPPYGLGFMGKEWDDLPPGVEWAAECLRVLRPGGYLLAFGGTRTYHRLACAVEDAGFEIRDSIAWLYGSGFPKSLDVGKAIDNAAGAQRTIVGPSPTANRHPRGVTGSMRLDGFSTVAELEAAAARGGRCPNGRDAATTLARLYATTEAANSVTAPATAAAREWAGWGTALKPAFEPVVVARKPLAGSVAGNVQEWGCGALNIDACRTSALTPEEVARSGRSTNGAIYGKLDPVDWKRDAQPHPGRWPANVVLDGTQADALDQQSGVTKSGGRAWTAGDTDTTAWRELEGREGSATRGDYARKGDSGGASRYFPTFRYQAKAPTAERPSYVTEDGRKVTHPTVKPLGLMRWLVRLVTPPGGVVLDPFAGSGATVEACLIEGFDCIAIERDSESLPLIQQRIDRQAGTLPFDRPA